MKDRRGQAMGGLMRLLLLLGILGYGCYATYQSHNHTVAAAEAPAAQEAQAATSQQVPVVNGSVIIQGTNVSETDKADAVYLGTYMNSIQAAARGYPFGATVQNLSLPSGKTAQISIQKTKTGWCPERNEPTFSISVNAQMSVAPR
jgi:hypothetical protein